MARLAEKERLERIVRKHSSRGGINSSQGKSLTMFNKEQQAVINNAFGSFWYEHGKRYEQEGREKNHIVNAVHDKPVGLWGRLGIAEDSFGYAIMMFSRTSQELRLPNLKNDILPHIIKFGEDYSQEYLLEKAEELAGSTPDTLMEASIKLPRIINPFKKSFIYMADGIAGIPYDFDSDRDTRAQWTKTRKFNFEFKAMSRLYRAGGRSDLSQYCQQFVSPL